MQNETEIQNTLMSHLDKIQILQAIVYMQVQFEKTQYNTKANHGPVTWNPDRIHEIAPKCSKINETFDERRRRNTFSFITTTITAPFMPDLAHSQQ